MQVIGKQWSWDFNYLDDDAYDTGQHAQDVGSAGTGVLRDQVTLYLPVDERVEFTLDSRDVIHSFWVPAFLFKMDMIPGKTNTFQVTPHRGGRRTWASAPSSAASTTRRCCSTSRSSRARSTTRTSRS